MDKLDKLLLEHLPDTGLCARGRRIQADRRARMKAAIEEWGREQNKTDELIIDEMQLENLYPRPRTETTVFERHQ